MLSLTATAQAQPAPYHHWRALDTDHFEILVPTGLEREGRVAGAAAERAYAQLAKVLPPPRGPISIIVSDDADYSNGYATPFPTNHIVIFAAPPVESQALRLNEDWIGIVITHELTHIFHLDRADGLWGVAQTIFGRAPALFPNQYGPSWLTEGLAVYFESHLTAGGRLRDDEHRMLARAAATGQEFPRLFDLSLGSPRFPGGEGAYGFGSLFVDYLANRYGDSAITKFVAEQSSDPFAFRLNHDAKVAFGTSFEDAYGQWRDSVEKSTSGVKNPLPEWRDLTAHGYYALFPRWTSDSTLVYASADSRSADGVYTLSLNGDRHRIGRRNALSASVPWPGGGLLFAQPDLVSTAEVRSDLYVEKDGDQRQLTNDLRLVQPDVRRDGTIVATQLDAGRASLVLLDSTGRNLRAVRYAEPDETWSEPRWSPDGKLIAVSHRRHGETFSIEVIDASTGTSREIERGDFILSAPAWSADGKVVLFTSEESGVPELVSASVDGTRRHPAGAPDSGGTGLYDGDVSPNGRAIAGVSLRADGYHVGVAPFLPRDTAMLASDPARFATAPPVDSQPLATGAFHDYSPWSTVLPRYWYPLVEAAPISGVQIGAQTSGSDVIGRHSYTALFAIPTTGSNPTAQFNYQYSGFDQPFVDVFLSQDVSDIGHITQTGTNTILGDVLERSQVAQLSVNFVRPRYRTYSSLAFGAEIEHRTYDTDPAKYLSQLDPSLSDAYNYPSAFIAGQWSNAQRPGLSVSPEDGISVAFTARERYRSGDYMRTASASLIATGDAYKSLDLSGFSHSAIAMRLAVGVADTHTSSAFAVGGTSGSTIQLVPGYDLGEGRRTFGVRGFPAATTYGTDAAVASLEYRMPLALGAVGLGSAPFFLDRTSLSFFSDAGVATCAKGANFPSICAPAPIIGRTIASVGAELGISAAILAWDSTQLIRLGLAAPVAGADLVNAKPVSAYVAFGLSF